MDDLTLVAVVVIALFFDFTNGFHDTANSIATSVSTRAISPRLAVLMSAVLNFAGAFVSFKVAATIASGLVDSDAITLDIVLAGLVGGRAEAVARDRDPGTLDDLPRFVLVEPHQWVGEIRLIRGGNPT